MKLTLWLCALAISTGLLLPSTGFDAQTGTTQSTKSKAPAKAAPSSQEIADAKAKGLVWVNTSTHVYHRDGSMYGATKHGKFMSEDDAKKAGFRPAKESVAAKTATAKTTTSK